MRFKRHSKLEHGLGQMDIAPFVDIVFLLLAFFIFISLFSVQSGISVTLPKTVTSKVIQKENLIVAITGENVIYLNGKIITLKELEIQLGKKENQSRPILIKANRRANVGRIVDVWDLCRRLNIQKINIATN